MVGLAKFAWKMLSEHCNNNADIYNIFSVYMADAGAQIIENRTVHWGIKRWSDGEKDIDIFFIYI